MPQQERLRQVPMRKQGIAFQGLDNGILSCADLKALQRICDELDDKKIDGCCANGWTACRIRSMTKIAPPAIATNGRSCKPQFALTQVLDHPVTGRLFFEQVIRENMDSGRPDQVQLIFNRRITRRTPGRFRTRVITEGVTPSVHVDYKRSRIKQYHKESQALGTETSINDTRDFAIGRRLHNLPALRRVGFAANRRLLEVERVSHDCALGEEAFQERQRPRQTAGQRVPPLRFADPQVQALLQALLMFVFLPQGFTNKELRQAFAVLLGKCSGDIKPARMSYELRRLHLHGLIEKTPKSHRYRLTAHGLRTAMYCTRVYSRDLRPGLALLRANDEKA